MEYPPAKRQRSTKFDTRHRHKHYAKDANDGETELQATTDTQLEAALPLNVESHLRIQDSVGGKAKHGLVQGYLQRRQALTVDVAVTVDSTAIISIGVDADGTPVTTGTTTLAADTSSNPANPTSTVSDSASPETSPSITGVVNPTSSTFTSSIATSESVTSASQGAETATSPSSTLSSLPTTELSETAITTSSGFSGYGFVTTTASEATSSQTTALDTSSLFPSLTATNGTTTSGVSFSSSISDAVTAAGVTSTAVSFSGSDSVSINATTAGVHTTHRSQSSSTSKSHDSSSIKSTSSGFRSYTSTSHYSSSSHSSTAISSTETYAGLGGASGAGNAAPSTTSGPSGNGSVNTNDDDTNAAPPATIAGSVVGSVAGVALLGVIFFYLLRMYHKKRSLTAERSNSARRLGIEDPFSDPAPAPSGTMTQRSSAAFFSAAAAGLFGRVSKHSEPEVPPEERGFRKVSGRKLPSAFSPGMEALPVGAASVARSGGPGKEMGLSKESAASPTSSDALDSPTDTEHTARDTVDWYSRGSDSFATTAVPPDTASTGLTHLVPGVAGADFGRERYPSSTYSVDTSGVPRTYSPPQTTRLTETLLPSPARTPVIQQPSPFGRASHVPGIGHGDGPAIEPEAGSQTSPIRHPSGRGYSLDGSRGSRFSENIP